MQPGAGRETDLSRPTGVREQRQTVLVVTNGESTEVDYLTGLKQQPWVIHRLWVVKKKASSPTQVIKVAASRRDEDDFDQAWAVCDVDHYPTAGSTTEARKRNVTLLWSNPCFEVWLLLHHTDCTRYLENADKVKALLKTQVKGWDKTKLNFADFSDKIDDAVRRARKLDSPPGANPSTALWQLVEALR